MDKSNGRTANFTEEDIKLLLKLVEENKNVIENKKTDNVTSQQKEIAWLRLCEFFNKESAQISGLDAVYDCDFIHENSNTLHSISLTSDGEENAGKEDTFCADGEIEDLEGPSCSWKKYNPGMLKMPINQKLKNPYSKPKKITSWSKLADVKAKWCEEKAKREIELMEEEYKSRLAYWEEKKLLEKIEFELRMKMLQEKHEKEMERQVA